MRLLPPLIPVMEVVLAYPLWQLGLLISLYSLGSGLAQAPLGVLSDRYDRRYLLPTGLAIAGLGYIVFALATTLGAPLPALGLFGHTFEGGFLVMCAAMLVVGVGSAVTHPVGYPMISDNVSADNKGKALGIFGASSKVGDSIAPAMVAALIIVMTWDSIVALFGIIGIIYGVGLYLVLRSDEYETVPSGQRETEDADRDSDLESEPEPSDRRTFLYPMVAIYCFFVSKMLTTRGIDTFLPTVLVAVYAYSIDVGGIAIGTESIANVYFAVMLLAGAVTQIILGSLTDTYDSRLVILSCMGVATVGMIVLALFDLHPLALLVIVVVLGTGLYGVNPARDTLISDITPPEHEGRTFGYIWTAASLTGAALPAIIGYLFEVLGMREGLLLLAIGTALAALCISTLYSDRVYVERSAVSGRAEASD